MITQSVSVWFFVMNIQVDVKHLLFELGFILMKSKKCVCKD